METFTVDPHDHMTEAEVRKRARELVRMTFKASQRIEALEAALRNLAAECAEEFFSPDTESGPGRCEDGESVFVTSQAEHSITFGAIRCALALLK